MSVLAETIFKNSLDYLKEIPREKRKQIGQFFTSLETAKYMASMIKTVPKDEISILDPGAGSGILTAAVIDSLQSNPKVNKIKVVCYETNEDVLPLLKRNLEFLKKNSIISVEYKIKTVNYLTSQRKEFNGEKKPTSNHLFDIIICNPPYKKISKGSAEAFSMAKICHGAPNLYFLFMAMGLFNLKKSGEAVFIIPRSWTSGAYFEKFRKYFFESAVIKQMHLFISRDKVFESENVLQETMIIKFCKHSSGDTIKITTSESNSEFKNTTLFEAQESDIICGTKKYVYLPTSQDDLIVLRTINKYQKTLLSTGLKMRTGLTVGFRNSQFLRDNPGINIVPLFYSQHFNDGLVEFPVGRDDEYIATDKPGLLQQNKNYLFIKRFTSKEESRRLQSAIFIADKFPDYSRISTDNKVNFIEGLDFDLTKEQVYGLYVLFNWTFSETA